MATRPMRPRRDEGILKGYQPMPERAPSLVRAERPLFLRIVAFFALIMVAIGAMAMILAANNKGYMIGPEWGFCWFIVGLAGLIYHAFADRDVQYRMTYAVLGCLLFFAAVVLRIYPIGPRTGLYFLPYGIPCLALALIFLLAVVRYETDTFLRINILRLFAIGGGIMIGAGWFFSNVNVKFWFINNVARNFLPGEGLLLMVLGLLYLGAYTGMQGPGSRGGFLAGLSVGAMGLLAFVVALLRSWLNRAGETLADAAGSEAAFSYLVPDGLVLMGLGLVYLIVALGVCGDFPLVVMTRRELAAFFYSPIGYLVILSMTVIGWFSFNSFVVDFLRAPRMEPILINYILHFIPVSCFMFVVSVLTMRLLSEEKRAGTLEVLLTAPVNEVTVALSKFFAAFLFLMISLLPWGLFLVALRVVGREPFDYRPMLSFYIAMAFTGAGFVALGLFFSSITRNQIISAVLTFATLMGLTVIFWKTQTASPPWDKVLAYISYLDLWIMSLEGQFAPRFLLFHLSLAVFFIYLTVKVLEARKWT